MIPEIENIFDSNIIFYRLSKYAHELFVRVSVNKRKIYIETIRQSTTNTFVIITINNKIN